MNKTVYLEKQDVPEGWRTLLNYSGTKFRAEIHEDNKLRVRDTDLDSSGGTYSTFMVLVDGMTPVLHRVKQWPEVGEQIIALDRWICVEHSMFCGKDMGLIFHCGPGSVNQLRIPMSTELSEAQKDVLWVHCSRKASYNGKNRFDMLNEALRWKNKPPMEESIYIRAKHDLQMLGMLNKAGAVTVKGRNEYANFRNRYM